MHHSKNEILKALIHLMRSENAVLTLKIAGGSYLSIMLAQALNLEFASSAGIITLLTILTTKWATVKLAFNRFLSFMITVAVSRLVFEHSGDEQIRFFFFMLLLVGISLSLKWRDTISVNAVTGTHFMATNNFGYEAVLNEFLLMMTGVTVAVLLNLIQEYRSSERQLQNDMRYIEEAMQAALMKIAAYLRHQKTEGSVWDDIIALEQYLSDALDRACRYQDNTFVSHPGYYIHYVEMRTKQTNILHNLHYEIKKISNIPEQAEKIADYMEYLSQFVIEKNVPDEQFLVLDEMKEQFRQEMLPRTREEFEGRAVLYHVMMDLEEFLKFKQRFIESLDSRQKKIYWKNG